MCGPLFWGFGGFWWVFPLIALVMCLGCLIMMFGLAGTGPRFGCMSGHRGTSDDKGAESPR